VIILWSLLNTAYKKERNTHRKGFE